VSFIIQPSAGGATVTEFTSSGTYTVPSTATFLMVECWGAGAGGGSGRRGAAASERFGGAGGGGGAYGYRLFKASELTSTVAVTIGAGGAGGAAVTVDSTNGNVGSTGGTTSFGSFLSIYGGNSGAAAGVTGPQGGLGGGVLNNFSPRAGIPPAGSAAGHFGAGNGSGTANNGQPSGFGGGSGGGAGFNGGSSYQGGPGGGGGGTLNSSDYLTQSTAGGGISADAGTGATRVAYPGSTGNNGSGRQGASGGAAGSLTIDTMNDVSFGNGTFAGISNRFATTGIIYTSSNGTNNWVAQTGPSNRPVSKMLHDGTQFVIFNNAGNVWTTTNFVTYTARNNWPVSASPDKVRFLNGRYFVVQHGTNGIYTSTDLVTWTQLSTGVGGSTYDIAWTGTNYVVVSNATPFIRYSSNLTSWSTSTGTVGAAYTCVSNGSGTVFCNSSAVAQEGLRSTDNGQSFSAITSSITGGSASDAYASFVNATYFIVFSSNLWTSTDGTNWTQRISAQSPFGPVAFDGTTLVTGNDAPSTSDVAYTALPASLGTWTARTLTAINGAGGTGGNGGQPGGGGGGGGASLNGNNSGAGGTGGNGLVRVYAW